MTNIQVVQDSGAEFIKFWDYVIKKGLMNEYTARSLGSASKMILSVEEDWEKITISDINPEDFISRFTNLHSKDYSPRTLKVYGRRFNRALQQYLSYLKNPSDWKPPISKRTSSKKTSAKDKDTQTTNDQSVYIKGSQTSFSDMNLKMISHQFPLRDDCVIQLRLPLDLTEADIERLRSFLKVLVIPSIMQEE